jgi:predicted PurR-regulated permease PerM
LLNEISSASGLVEQYASGIANNLLGAGTTFLMLLFNGLAIALFTFYLCADGPRFRRVICSLLPPRTQREVLRAWEIAISKTGGYLYSRALLALFSGVAHYLVLVVLDIPFAFALALWMGVLSLLGHGRDHAVAEEGNRSPATMHRCARSCPTGTGQRKGGAHRGG